MVSLLLPPLGNGRLWDALNRTLPTSARQQVVVVGIDDASLADYGPVSSWPPGLFSQALNTLEAAGARAIGLDLPFNDPAAAPALLRAAHGREKVVLATAPGEPVASAGQVNTGVGTLIRSQDDIVRSYTTAFQDGDRLQPTFAWQLARAGGAEVPLNTTRRLIRLTRPDPGRLPAIPFRNIVNGEVPRRELQGRVVLVGLTGRGRPEVRGPYHLLIPSVHMQARLVTSQLMAPFVTFPRWLRALLGVLVMVAAIRLRGLWGYGLAFALLALSVPLWLLGVLLPAVTLSLCAVLGAALVAVERIWTLRQLDFRDPSTGCGNRAAFMRAAEQRWQVQPQRPLGLVLLEISGLQQVNDLYGWKAGHEVLREVSGRLGQARGRRDMLFRWGPEEFAVLLDNVTEQELQHQRERLQTALSGLTYRQVPVQVSVASALSTPEMDSATQLVEAAHRDRHRTRLTDNRRS